MDTQGLVDKVLKKLGQLSTDIVGGVIGYFIVNKIENGQPVIINGKPLKILDPKKLRSEAPHLYKSNEDEAKFNALVIGLPPGLQKNLEKKMAATNLGHHQRDDIVLTVVDVAALRGTDIAAGEKDAREVLTQLAQIENDAEWKRRAVAFKLMKENEDDYIGAKLDAKARELITLILHTTEVGNRLSRQEARRVNRGTDQILYGLRQRQQLRGFRRYFSIICRATALPWDDPKETDMCDDYHNRDEKDSNDSNCGNGNPRRSKLGIHMCMKGGFNFDFGGYKQRAVKEDLPQTPNAGVDHLNR